MTTTRDPRFASPLAEELAEGLPLSVVRPAIVESALAHPYPGWIDGFKMADPIILAYGRGILREFPGLPDGVLDVIPVDLVVNATLAVAAAPAGGRRSSTAANCASRSSAAIRCRTWPCSERTRATSPLPCSATPRRCAWVSWWWRSATHTGSPGP